MSAKGKIALITGASAGIGKAIALEFAKAGINLVLTARNAERLNNVKAECEKFGVKVATVTGDLLDDNFASNLPATAEKCFNGLDIIINDAGLATNCPMENMDMALYDNIMNLNVRAPYIICKSAIPVLRKSDYATILNIASVVAHKGYENQSAYTASKHALLGFTKVLAKEVYKENIRVHAICPGGVYTEMIAITRPDLNPKEVILPEDISKIALFMIENRTNALIDEICVHRANKEPFM